MKTFDLIKENKGSCDIEWCKTCPLSLSKVDNSITENIFHTIGDELGMTKEERYRVLPCTLCIKEVFINKNPFGWRDELYNLIDEIVKLGVKDAYNYILNKYPDDINRLRDIMKERLDFYRSYVPVESKGCCE